MRGTGGHVGDRRPRGTRRTSIREREVLDSRRMYRLGGTMIRAVEVDDLPMTRVWRNDPRVSMPALGRRFPITESGERAWFEALAVGAFPTQLVWAVADDDS